MAKKKEVKIPFPVGGKNVNAAYAAQPEGTCPDCLNVLPFDAGAARLRGGQRPGFANQSNKVNASNFKILRLHQATASVANAAVTRLLAITANTDKSIYYSTGLNTGWALTTTGSGVISATATDVSTCDIFGKAYTVDGTSILVTDCNQATPVTTTLGAPSGNVWTVTGGGSDIAGTTDQFQFGLQTKNGDFDLKAQIPSFLASSPYARAGLMARDAAGATDKHMSMMIYYGSSVSYVFEYRALTAGNTVFASLGLTAGVNTWVRLRRVGAVFTGFYSTDGTNWTTVYTYDTTPAAMNATVNIGFAVVGHNASATAIFQNVSGAPTNTYVGTDIGAPAPAGSTTTAAVTASGSPPSGATIAVNYMGRLALSGLGTDPQNIFMSRAGVPGDFDYSQVDVLAAFALNSSDTIGRVGEWIRALIPWQREEMVIGCQHTLFLMRGNPRDGGSIQLISPNTGVLSKDAWCVDPIGNLYFIGTGGLYKIPANWGYRQQPEENLSLGKIDSLMASLCGTGAPKISMAYDAVRHQIWIFFSRSSGSPSTHLVYDLRTGGFFPQRFTTDTDNPNHALMYQAYDSGQQSVVVGNQTSQILVLTDAQLNDNGVLINAFVEIGALIPYGEGNAGRLQSLQMFLAEQGIFGASAMNVTLSVKVAKDAYGAINAPDRTLALNYTQFGRQVWLRQRISGGVFVFRLANATLNKTFAMESLSASFVEGGMLR